MHLSLSILSIRPLTTGLLTTGLLTTGLLLAAVLAPVQLSAGEPHRSPRAPASPSAHNASAECAGSKAELAAVIKDFDHVSGKLHELASTFAAEDFDYRPTDAVRTVGQTYVHVALANYWLASMLGTDLPEGFSEDLETTLTEPKEIVRFFNGSVRTALRTVEALDVATLDQAVDMMGKKQTRRNVLTILTAHSHEHLGQLAVYLRLRGGVPPWTAREGGE